MRHRFGLNIGVLLLLAAGPALSQAPAAPAFDVASIKPSVTMDMAKMQAAMQAGRMPKFGPHITESRAEYNSMSLKDLVANAYKVKAYQVTGPDWLITERFDIEARIPEGAAKDDVPRMLQSLLQERFKLTAHLDTQEHPALVLVVGKGGPKLKEVPAPETVAFDESTPLKSGEMNIDTPDGPARMTRGSDGSAVINMGSRGTFTQRFDGQNMRLEASSITMAGFTDMLNSMLQMGGGGGRQVVDMTDLKGHYQVAINISMAELMANARAMGMGGPGGGGADAGASDPSGGATIFASVQALGLKLESRKASVVQVVIDHVEKTPTDN